MKACAALLEHASRVDGEGKASNVTRFVRGQEQNGVADVDRLDPAHGEHMHELRSDREVVRAWILQIRAEQLHRAFVHEHRCVHIGGVNGVDANRVLPKLDGEGAHQTHHAMLGGNVMTGVWVGLEPSNRTGQHDRTTATTGEDVWHTDFDGFPYTRKVYVDHVLPVVLAGLVKCCSAVPDSSVGDDDVEPPQLLDTTIHDCLQCVVIAHIDLGRDDAAIMCLHQIGGFDEVIGCRRGDLAAAADRLTDVDRDDVGTLLRQSHRLAAALSASSTRNEGDLAFDPTRHIPLLS